MNQREIIQEFSMKSLAGRKKKVSIFLPKDYEKTTKKYPVLYMHDGQNLIHPSPFSGYAWDALATLDRYQEKTGGVILVGLHCHEEKRVLEYSPYIPKLDAKNILKDQNLSAQEIKPEADAYGRFIVKELKPWIDKTYRTKKEKEHTWIAGSSCGGVISIYLGFKYQEVFSIIGAFSPAYRFLAPTILHYVNGLTVKKHMRIYHDMGTREAGLFSFVLTYYMKRFHQLMLHKMPEAAIKMIKDKKAKHNEYFWSKRFPIFLDFILETYQNNALTLNDSGV